MHLIKKEEESRNYAYPNEWWLSNGCKTYADKNIEALDYIDIFYERISWNICLVKTGSIKIGGCRHDNYERKEWFVWALFG